MSDCYFQQQRVSKKKWHQDEINLAWVLWAWTIVPTCAATFVHTQCMDEGTSRCSGIQVTRVALEKDDLATAVGHRTGLRRRCGDKQLLCFAVHWDGERKSAIVRLDAIPRLWPDPKQTLLDPDSICPKPKAKNLWRWKLHGFEKVIAFLECSLDANWSNPGEQPQTKAKSKRPKSLVSALFLQAFATTTRRWRRR